jgi:hypothetical protein
MNTSTNWYVSLAGFHCDLRAARACFNLPEASLFESPEFKTYLRSTEFCTLATAADVELRACELLRPMNGALRVVADNYRPIHAWSVHDERVPGYHACCDARDRWHRQNDADDRTASDLWFSEASRVTDAVRLFRIAREDAAVARALDLWNADRHGVSVYKIFELIREDAGQELVRFASRAETSCFTGSVNRPDVLGDYARHEVMPGERPRQTMSREAAEAFIQGLLYRWAMAKSR